MVKYSWGDKWDERQRREDEKRFYGPGGGGNYSGGDSAGGSGPPSKYRRGSSSGGRGKKAALVILLVAGLAVGVIFGLPLMHFSGPSSVQDMALLPKNQAPTDTVRVAEKLEGVAIPSNSGPSSNVKVVSQQLVAEQLVMLKKDVRELSAVIPAKNNGFLEAKIIPEKAAVVDVTLYKNGAKYCVNEPTCSFTIKGNDLATQKMMMPVKTGDTVKAVIISQQGSGFSQLVNVVLSVQYEESTPVAASSSKTVTEQQPSIIDTIYGKPKTDTLAMEKQIHTLINQYRSSHGLVNLTFDEKLASIARTHSQDMANNNYFEHVNLQGQDPSQRGTAAGYSCYKNYGSYYTNGLAENIWQGWLYERIWYTNGIPTSYDWLSQDKLAEQAAQDWFNSQGHRENILTSTYDREGLGVAISSDDKVYVTEDFC